MQQNFYPFIQPKALYPLNSKEILAKYSKDNVFMLFETGYVTDNENTSYIFTHPIKSISFYPDCDIDSFFDNIQQELNSGFYAAGYFSYEFSYYLLDKLNKFQKISKESASPLACFYIFKEAEIIKHDFNGNFFCFNESCEISNFSLNINKSEYVIAIDKIKEYIRNGDTYQVNYTLKGLFDCDDPVSLYLKLREKQAVSYSAFMKFNDEHVLSFSPELFFRKQGSLIYTRPMKGTIKRGKNLSEDINNADFLQNDLKNRAENIMIVDLLRNDLGKISEIGSVKADRLFDVERYRTLFQMTSQISAVLREDMGWKRIFSGIFPSGSVTGAPKLRTMEIINELEKEQRGIYTGALGFFTPNNDAVFNIPIRTIHLKGQKGEIGIGSGITIDSDAEDEFQECLLKARFLTDFGIKNTQTQHKINDFYLIETIKWDRNQMLYDKTGKKGLYLLDLHLKRLYDSAEYFDFRIDREKISDSLFNISKEVFESDKVVAIIRLCLFRDGNFNIELRQHDKIKRNSLRVSISNIKTNPDDVFFYHKTSNRELYNTEFLKARDAGYVDCIFTNSRGEVTEGAISNVFIWKNNRLITPAIESGLLNGTFRQYLLDKGIAVEQVITVEELLRQQYFYIGNSVRGLLRVGLMYCSLSPRGQCC